MNNFYKIGFGTWGFGGEMEQIANNDDSKDIADIQKALKLGIKHIDTAEVYADGKTEQLVGQAIKGFDRQELFIATKARTSKIGYTDIIKSCEESLERLQLKDVDLFYVHYPNPEIPLSDTAKGLNELYKKGLIKNIGISNGSVNTMKAYQEQLIVPIFASQCHYNLVAREPQRTKLLDYCKNNNIHFIAWRPVQKAYAPLNVEPLYCKGKYPLLDEMADKYNKSNIEIAIRWLTQQDNINIIFKSTNQDHMKEIINTQNFNISEEDMKNLTNNFPHQEDISFTHSRLLPLR